MFLSDIESHRQFSTSAIEHNKNDLLSNLRLKNPTEWQERWFLSSNAKDIGTCAERASISCSVHNKVCELRFHRRSLDNSKDTNLPHNTGLGVANNSPKVTAGVECSSGRVLPLSNTPIRGSWYGYDKKLDTHGSLWIEPYVLSRISRRMISNIKATKGSSDLSSSLEAEGHSNEESNLITHVQEPKSRKSLSKSDRNGKIEEPLDLSASTNSMRGQSPHSSPERKTPSSSVTKGGSVKTSTQKRGTRSMVSNQNLRSFVQSKLDSYRTKDNKYNGIIRILSDIGFLQYCYMLIKGKPGNMSKGSTKETLDGLTYEWFEKLSEDVKSGALKFTPARRVLVPKPGKKEKRPLGIGAPRDKIVQKGLQVLLEAIYEPMFLDCSHGFRPNKSTHSALRILYLKAHQHSWVIQGDISKCFDRIPHDVIKNLLKKNIVCDKTLTIILKALKVGYVDPETKQVVKSNIGTPQGSVLSPLLANIVLHELDKYLVFKIIPEYNKGRRRRTNPIYNAIAYARDPKNPNASEKAKIEALAKMREIPRMDTSDPNYRRSMYVRYADDFVFIVEGPRSEAVEIKNKIKIFLEENTGLELSDEKTLVSHVGKGFNFLGAHIKSSRHVGYRMKTRTVKGTRITMRANVRANVNVPINTLIEKLIKAGFARRNHKGELLAKPMTAMVNMDHATIIQFYNPKIHGIINYYSFARNRVSILNIVWILRLSLAKTLARKFKLKSARQAFKKFGPYLKDPETDLQIFVPKSLPTIHKYNNVENLTPATDLIGQSWYGRLTKTNLFKKCAICNTSSNMHHLRKVNDVRAKMANSHASFKVWQGAYLRKQVPLCQYHHILYHSGKLLNYELDLIAKYSQNMATDFKNNVTPDNKK